MAVLPATPIVKINFSGGASFGNPFILGSSQLGFAELASSIPNIIDVSAQTIMINTQRGRNVIQDQYQAGTATVRVLDPNGDFNPQNTSSPYYGQLVPLRKIQIAANYSSTVYNIFNGYITDYKYSWPKDQETGYVDFVCVDAFRLLFNTNITTVSGGTAGQTTGQRVTAILDSVSWPPAFRSIQAGSTVCQVDPATSRTALDAIRTAEFTEQGAFYIDANGSAVFKGRQFVYDAQAASPIVFNQTGTGIPYFDIRFALDDKTIVNKMTATRIGGTAQTYSDATSIATYFTHGYNVSNLLMTTDANALALATAYVTTRKDTTIRIDSITLDLVTLGYGSGVTAALDLDFFDTVEITNETAQGSTITKKLQVQQIVHNITPNSWKTTLGTQEPLLDVMY